jgi:NuA3 HAT complex component NTO1
MLSNTIYLLSLLLTFAFRLDSKHVFKDGLKSIRGKLNSRSYTSVAVFSADLANVLSSDLGVEAANTAELQEQVSGRAIDMTVEQRERRKLAKRIVKAVQPALEEALRNESELSGRPFEKQIRELDMMLDNSILSRRESFSGSTNGEEIEIRALLKPINGGHSTLQIKVRGDEIGQHGVGGNGMTFTVGKQSEPHDVDMVDAPNETGDELDGSIAQLNGELSADAAQIVAANTPPPSTNGAKGDGPHGSANLPHNSNASAPEPPTPPLSLGGLQQSTLVSGGIPWYVEPFDPDGTTIHEERWTGPEVLREMSEELTDIDDEELEGLGGEDYDATQQDLTTTTKTSLTPATRNRNIKKNGKARRRWRGFKK